jgi:hypothetical protein
MALIQEDTFYNDGKVTRVRTNEPMIEMNGEQFPVHPSFNAPLNMQGVLFDKINVPFMALGYEISFESR